MTFPSGWLWPVGERDFELLVSLGFGLSVGFPVGRGKDAEGDGDAGLKVQVDDFYGRERTLLEQPSGDERKTRRILWLLFLETKVEEGKEEKREHADGDLLMILLFFARGGAFCLAGCASCVMCMEIIGGAGEQRRGEEGF